MFWIGIASPIIFSWSVKATYLRVVQNPWSFAYFNSVFLFGETSQSLLWTSMTQIFKSLCKVRLILGIKRYIQINSR